MSIVMGHGDVYLDGSEIIGRTNLGVSNCYSEDPFKKIATVKLLGVFGVVFISDILKRYL